MSIIEQAAHDAARTSRFSVQDTMRTLGWMQQIRYPDHQILEVLRLMGHGIYTPLDMLPMIDAALKE